MSKNKALTTAGLQSGRAEAQAELQQAREAYAKAAYAYALDRNDEAARDALLKAKEHRDLLEAEIGGLEAAIGEASRRELADELDVGLTALEASRADALEASDAMAPAFAKVADAVKTLSAAWADCKEAQGRANRAEAELARHPRQGAVYYGKQDCKPLLEALLWYHFRNDHLELTRSDALIDSGGRVFPDRPAEVVAKRAENARAAINVGADDKARDLRERADAARVPA